MFERTFFSKYLILVVLLSLFSVRALFHSGLPPTHDGEYHIIRFYEFYKTLTSGSLYPRWAEDLNSGMGAPLFNYVYPLPNYFSAVIHFLGVSFIDAFKLNFIVATIIGGFFMYLFSRLYFKELGGVVSSIFYTFAPYRFLDIFIRGSVGEVWALGFFPAFMWSLTKLFQEEKSIYIGLSGLFLALTIFSHNILALMFFLFSIFYTGFLLYKTSQKTAKVWKVFFSYLLGLGVSAIFWIPALLEKKFVRGLDVFNLKENFPEIFQLLIPSWGSGFSGGTLSGQMSFQIGLANLLIIFLSFLLVAKLRKKTPPVIIFFLLSFILLFFLMTKNSVFLWENIPFLNYFQFPWRLLSLEIFIASFLSGFVWRQVAGSKITGRLKTAILLFLFITPVMLTLGYAKPAYYMERSDNYYVSRPNFISGTNSPGNVFNTVWAGDVKKMEGFQILEGIGILDVKRNSTTEFEIKSKAENYLLVLANVMYFPGWRLYVDGNLGTIKPSINGQIEFNLKPEEYLVKLKLLPTTAQYLATLISILSVLLLIILFLRNYIIIRK